MSSLVVSRELKNVTLLLVYALQVEMTGISMFCSVHIVVYSDSRAGCEPYDRDCRPGQDHALVFFLSFLLSSFSLFFTPFVYSFFPYNC